MILYNYDFNIKDINPTLINYLVSNIGDSMVPLFKEVPSTNSFPKVKLEGTAFYFEVGGKYFLSTAYHVLFEDDRMLQFNPDRLLYPQGNVINSIPRLSKIIDCKAKDYAIIPLSSPLTGGFRPFLIDENMRINSHFKNFLCIGYPSKCAKQFKDNISGKALNFICKEEKEKIWQFDKKDYETSFRWIRSKCKDIKGNIVTCPETEGISGGIVLSFSQSQFCFFGNLTRYNPRNKRTFFATTVDYGKIAAQLNQMDFN